MISLEQIRALEKKVSLVIEQLARAREENTKLRAKLKATQTKTADLESLVSTYRQEQDAIEKSILSVLSKLDKLEDEVSTSAGPGKKDNSAAGLGSDETAVREEKAAVKETIKNTAGLNAKKEGNGNVAQAAVSSGKQDELDIF